MSTVTSTIAPKTKSRIAYGFKLDFPDTFTIRSLRRKRHDMSYITAYMRVKKALKDGVITVAGKQAPKTVRKGRQELIYARVNAKAVVAVVKTNAKATVATALANAVKA